MADENKTSARDLSSTVPPPEGGDAYSNATVVREASPEMLETIRKLSKKPAQPHSLAPVPSLRTPAMNVQISTLEDDAIPRVWDDESQDDDARTRIAEGPKKPVFVAAEATTLAPPPLANAADHGTSAHSVHLFAKLLRMADGSENAFPGRIKREAILKIAVLLAIVGLLILIYRQRH